MRHLCSLASKAVQLRRSGIFWKLKHAAPAAPSRRAIVRRRRKRSNSGKPAVIRFDPAAVPLTIAQPFMAGVLAPKPIQVPEGTTEPLLRAPSDLVTHHVLTLSKNRSFSALSTINYTQSTGSVLLRRAIKRKENEGGILSLQLTINHQLTTTNSFQVPKFQKNF
jgi:hypothetical protein